MHLKVPRVARELDLTEERVYDLVRQRILPATRLGRQIRISKEALDQFVRDGGKALPGGWRREPADDKQ